MLTKVQFKPGINRENTNYSNEGGWFDGDKIRFRSGYPEKIGGWTRAAPGYTYDGVCRSIINWFDLSSNKLIGLGTHKKYYILPNLTDYKNITPIRLTVNPTGNNPFATTTGSSLVTVTITSHNAQQGDFVTFSGVPAATIGGIDGDLFNAEFEIVRIISSTQFQIDLGELATSTATGGGAAVKAEFQISIGLPVYSIGTGWGAGVWNGTSKSVFAELAYTSGSGNVLLDKVSTTINVDSTTSFTNTGFIQIDSEIISYTGKTATSFTGCTRGASIGGSSTPATVHSLMPTTGSATPPPIKVYQVIAKQGTTGWGLASDVAFGVGQQLRLWSHDTFGEDLVINPRGGPIYYWSNNTAAYPPAVELSVLAAPSYDETKVPTNTNQVLVSDVSRFVIAIGANPYNSATFDPMTVRWSDQENPYQWVISDTTQSGEQRLSAGSYTVCARETRQEILIWTDSALFSMQYLGPPYVWGFTLLMDNISIVSPNAVSIVNNVAFWMGADKFYSYSGRVDTLPCTVRQYIFQDLAYDQAFQIVSGTNEGFSEVWWHYTSNEEVARANAEQRSPTNDKYVVYNYLDQVWYYGTLNRTAWLDSALYSTPMAATGNDTAGVLVFHERGYDNAETGSPVPINAYIQSSDFDITDGDHFSFVRRMLPDVNFSGSTSNSPTVYISLLPRRNSGINYLGVTNISPQPINSSVTTIPVSTTYGFDDSGYITIDTEIIYYSGKTDISFTGCVRGSLNTTAQSHAVNAPVVAYYTQTNVTRTAIYPVQQFTGQVYTRVRGRQISFRIASTDLGTAWQLGTPRLDIMQDGRR